MVAGSRMWHSPLCVFLLCFQETYRSRHGSGWRTDTILKEHSRDCRYCCGCLALLACLLPEHGSTYGNWTIENHSAIVFLSCQDAVKAFEVYVSSTTRTTTMLALELLAPMPRSRIEEGCEWGMNVMINEYTRCRGHVDAMLGRNHLGSGSGLSKTDVQMLMMWDDTKIHPESQSTSKQWMNQDSGLLSRG